MNCPRCKNAILVSGNLLGLEAPVISCRECGYSETISAKKIKENMKKDKINKAFEDLDRIISDSDSAITRRQLTEWMQKMRVLLG